ncbi:MAG: hypothetical protein EOQ39_22395 [Mesorhizobium sp.]|uniref:hypothetical protein n=1 Tax=Mesorhizobium sp. TaxID=1871066 RepID=UPI000FE86429|nr:hypothetical protein [Mesorhizobium sp.]RWB05471.1 MAG: hypothetical protein EOQ37_14515 [Mesorhizobium sp.]RWB12558.1 MAG: hypothetical protein EOQ39_22395 [Mesorhizobium sp.]
MFADRWFGKRYFGNRYFGPHGSDDPSSLHQPGGGFYRRPIKYVRDGKIINLNELQEPVLEVVEWPELSPQIIAALRAGVPVDHPAPVDLAAILEQKMGQLMIQRHLADIADDEAITALLLA